MFEREFYDNDLDKIESEKEFLNKMLDEFVNFKVELTEFVKLANKIIESCNKNSIYDFLKNCDELEKLDDYHCNPNNPMSYIVKKFFFQTYEIKRNLDKDLQKHSSALNELLNKIKNFGNFILKIKKLLDEEKEIIQRHGSSTNLNEKSKLYRQFLEKEKQIYEIYCSNSKIKNEKKRYIEHMSNAVELDIRKIYSYFSNHTSAFISILTLFGVFLYIPYFLSISEIPQNNANIMAIVVSIAIVLITFLCLIFSNYFLFVISRDIQKITIPIIFIYHLIWFFIIAAPIAQTKHSNYIYEHIEILSLILFGLLLLPALCYVFKDKEKDLSIAYALLFVAIFMLIDWFIILIVYLRIGEINGFYAFAVLLFLFISRLVSIGMNFNYRLLSIFAILILFMFIWFSSKDFVRLARLGNYNDSFKADTEFVPPDILDANLTNCGAKNFTCIEKIDENSIKFTNLKIIIVLDNKKYKAALNPKFECEIKDNNKSAICSVGGSKLLLDKTNLSCRSHLMDDNKTCSYEFETREKG